MLAENLGIEDKLFNYIIDSINDTPFYNLLGIKPHKIGKEFAELSVISVEQHINPIGMIHGGLFMSLTDAAMGNAVRSMGIKAVTVDCSTGFISSAEPGEKFIGRGRVLRAGKKLIFTTAEIRVDDRLLATSHGTFYKTGDYSYITRS